MGASAIDISCSVMCPRIPDFALAKENAGFAQQRHLGGNRQQAYCRDTPSTHLNMSRIGTSRCSDADRLLPKVLVAEFHAEVARIAVAHAQLVAGVVRVIVKTGRAADGDREVNRRSPHAAQSAAALINKRAADVAVTPVIDLAVR